ncbi:MAG TPA: hypothetical protein VFG50_06285 [Rhodothermales bacterium]|nr:hypothetical protein [Rhodothermales bacterium]
MTTAQGRPLYRRWWFWLIAGVLMFLLGYLVGLSFTHEGHFNPLELLLMRTAWLAS